MGKVISILVACVADLYITLYQRGILGTHDLEHKPVKELFDLVRTERTE